jgi:adenylate kinase family enzyme
VRRIVIVGASGSGKSTMAARLSDRLGVTRIDLDELYHGPDWTPTPTPEFRAKVLNALDGAEATGWVVAGNYATVSDLTHGLADTVVWLDLGRRRCVGRVVRRSAQRWIRHERLWNGNRERLRDLVHRDPDRNVILATWINHPRYRERYESYANGPFWAHADVVRLTTPREVAAFETSAAV